MEAFHLLSRGGAKFNKNKIADQIRLFDPSADQGQSTVQSGQSTRLPAELDFFKYAESSTHKSTGSVRKERAITTLSGEGPSGEEKPIPGREPAVQSGKGKRNEDTFPVSSAMHRIAATGARVPSAIGDFSDLRETYGLSPILLQNLKNSGFTTPTAIQTMAIPILLNSRDLAAISPTGTGKTLAYLLPIFASLGVPSASKDSTSTGLGIRALVLAPTHELAGQIYNECLKLAQGRKWRIVLYNKASGSTLAQKEVRDKVDIIISTPLRLVSALQEGKMELSNARHLVLDEADRLFDKGFLDQTEEILASCTHPDVRKSVFSATLPAGAEAVAKRLLVDPIRVVVGLKDAASLHISQTLTYVGSESGKLLTLRQLLANAPPLPLLIFVQEKERATELHQELIYDNLTVDMLHSGMTAKQREDSVSRFRMGETWVLVCTEVMARGMDFGGVKGVLNYDFPASVQSYIHRIGRTGRAGRSGTAITYFTDADAPYVKSIANIVNQSNVQQEAFANAVATNLQLDGSTDAIVAPKSNIPEWMLKLPKPSQMKRRQLQKVPIKRKPVGVVAGRSIGKKEALRKRDMVLASKRRRDLVEDQGDKKKKRKIPLQDEWAGVDT